MTEPTLPTTGQTEAPATDDDLPITVPIQGMPKAPGTMEMRLLADQRRLGDGTDSHFKFQTPAVRVAGRLLTAAALAESHVATTHIVDMDHDTVEDLMPAGAHPRLRVVRGRKVNLEYPIKDGPNYIGRRDDAPVEIDLEEQEPAERIWTSRKHAVLHFADGVLELEDLNSLNGTFVNRTRVAPGERRILKINDIVQVGTIQMRVVA
jgi:FHA domain